MTDDAINILAHYFHILCDWSVWHQYMKREIFTNSCVISLVSTIVLFMINAHCGLLRNKAVCSEPLATNKRTASFPHSLDFHYCFPPCVAWFWLSWLRCREVYEVLQISKRFECGLLVAIRFPKVDIVRSQFWRCSKKPSRWICLREEPK